MNEQEFKAKTKKLALRVIVLVDSLPKGFAVMSETDQILAMAVASIKTLRSRTR